AELQAVARAPALRAAWHADGVVARPHLLGLSVSQGARPGGRDPVTSLREQTMGRRSRKRLSEGEPVSSPPPGASTRAERDSARRRRAAAAAADTPRPRQ